MCKGVYVCLYIYMYNMYNMYMYNTARKDEASTFPAFTHGGNQRAQTSVRAAVQKASHNLPLVSNLRLRGNLPLITYL